MSTIDSGAFGVLLSELGVPFAVTLEKTYAEAGTQSTKIPSGVWLCSQTIFMNGKPQPYRTYEIRVPGHSRLLFHRGNSEKDSDGCILVAESFGRLNGFPAVIDSADGFKDFMLEVNGVETFYLVVKGAA